MFEDGKQVECVRIMSSFSVDPSIRVNIEREISGDRAMQEDKFFKPSKSNPVNPKTGKRYSDAERLGSGDPSVSANKATRRLLDKRKI